MVFTHRLYDISRCFLISSPVILMTYSEFSYLYSLNMSAIVMSPSLRVALNVSGAENEMSAPEI